MLDHQRFPIDRLLLQLSEISRSGALGFMIANGVILVTAATILPEITEIRIVIELVKKLVVLASVGLIGAVLSYYMWMLITCFERDHHEPILKDDAFARKGKILAISCIAATIVSIASLTVSLVVFVSFFLSL